MRARLGIVFLAACAALPNRARSDEAGRARAHLLYVREAGAERCPDETQLRAEVAARLGYDPFSESAPSTISVTIRAGARGLKARIELVDRTGEVTGARSLTAPEPDCVALAEAVELAVSLAVDPLRFVNPPAPAAPVIVPPAPAATPPPESRPAPIAPPPAAPKPIAPPRPRSEREVRWRLGAGALAALGAAPTVNFGFTASAGVRGPHWSVDLEGRFDLPAGQPTGSVNATGSVETALYLATALPCFHVRLFSGCALLALGAQTADGINLPVTRKSASLFAAAGARAGIEVPLIPKLELALAADLLAAITRTRYTADGASGPTTVFDTPPISGAFHVGLLGYFR
ncbi:MAG: hypothetical protein ACHQ17_00260 [Polyangia bacterium]